jgi:hypothetical protein
LDHLTPSGILTVSRWYFRDLPGEMYRLTALASASLMATGIETPRDHIIIVRRMRGQESDGPDGIGTILVSKAPFSERDIEAIEEIVAKGQLELVLSPRFALDPTFETLTSVEKLDQFIAGFPLNITPPTDDKPFFFHTLRFRDIFNSAILNQGKNNFNIQAVSTLGILLITVVGLTFLCIIVPLAFTTKRESLKGSLPFFLFFAGIGLGFIFIEISQMQRLIIFLGHPTYSLSVVLFTLLLSSGCGSYLTQRVGELGLVRSASRLLFLLLCALIAFGLFTPYIIDIFQGSTTPLRILVAVATLFPLGIFMGMAFPFGMRLASAHASVLTPWLWGVNGATSVCASVLVVVIAISSGISTAFWIGWGCYVVALLAFIWAARRQELRVTIG